jgi:beta-glucanase (GH16 family)
MKKLICATIGLLCACNPNKTAIDAEFHPTERGWGSPVPIWFDEFNDNGLDPTKWVQAEFCGGYNHEKQCYRPAPYNITFDGAHAILTAQPQKCDGQDISAVANEVGTVTCPTVPTGTEAYSYTSARIHTRVLPINPANTWRYGRIEIRAKLPNGQGTWPAFWLMPEPQTYGPWPASGEIDMLEAKNLHPGSDPLSGGDILQANIHACSVSDYYPDPYASAAAIAVCENVGTGDYHKVINPKSASFSSLGLTADLVSNFHTYAMEWSDGDIRFFIDDLQYGRTAHWPDAHNRAPFQQPFYMIINLAVGGDMPVSIDDTTWLQTPTRAELVLDWIRIYACVPDALARNCIYEQDGLGKK